MRDDESLSSPGFAVDSQPPVALAAPVACASRDTRIVTASIPDEIAAQVAMACHTIERHLGATLKAIHLFGSALDGGLKPRSDIDLLATVSVRPTSRRAGATCADARPACLVGAVRPRRRRARTGSDRRRAR
ncbi:hypothetical protein [Burkholderia metallica]|uniref:hypothetical protein n=1 Tax=Burkholderia metallica TaxID=488729 RepID=UPI001FC7D7C4|nr:hypothetical protein [Burkholderia metallica]